MVWKFRMKEMESLLNFVNCDEWTIQLFWITNEWTFVTLMAVHIFFTIWRWFRNLNMQGWLLSQGDPHIDSHFCLAREHCVSTVAIRNKYIFLTGIHVLEVIAGTICSGLFICARVIALEARHFSDCYYAAEIICNGGKAENRVMKTSTIFSTHYVNNMVCL